MKVKVWKKWGAWVGLGIAVIIFLSVFLGFKFQDESTSEKPKENFKKEFNDVLITPKESDEKINSTNEIPSDTDENNTSLHNESSINDEKTPGKTSAKSDNENESEADSEPEPNRVPESKPQLEITPKQETEQEQKTPSQQEPKPEQKPDPKPPKEEPKPTPEPEPEQPPEEEESEPEPKPQEPELSSTAQTVQNSLPSGYTAKDNGGGVLILKGDKTIASVSHSSLAITSLNQSDIQAGINGARALGGNVTNISKAIDGAINNAGVTQVGNVQASKTPDNILMVSWTL